MAEETGAPLKGLGEFAAELDKIERDIHEAVVALNGARPAHLLAVHQAEWHVRGIVYHCRRLLESYEEVAQGVADRVVGITPSPDVVVMYAPAVQRMWFDFYALVNLARITLDHLRELLAPVFVTEFRNLPKSISGYLNGGTDCPVYIWLGEEPGVQYLSDMRNCLVHFRSFATSDNAMIVREGLSEDQFQEGKVGDWMRPMAKGVFRRVGEQGVSVNFFVPDVIFDRSGNDDKLAKFTYENKYNALSQSMNFVRLAAGAVMMSMLLLKECKEACFTYSKPKK